MPHATDSKSTTSALPVSQKQAQAELEFWKTKAQLAFVQYEVARRRLMQARDDLDIVKQIASGAFEEDAPAAEVGYYGVTSNGYVMSSRGPWCLGDQR